MKYIIVIISLCIIQLIKSSEIIIPFISELSEFPKDKSPKDFMSSLSSNQLYTKIKIGTPGQSLNFNLDFNIYNSFIIKGDIKGKKINNFLYNLSSTFNYLGKEEYFSETDFIKAINSTDIISFNENYKNYNFTFLHVYKFRSTNKIRYPGTLGFNVVPNQEPFHFETGIIYQFKKKNITNNYVFTLKFNENDYNGKIIIEKNIYDKYPLDYFKSDYCLATYDYTYYWGWNYLITHLNNKLLDIKQARIKPEFGLILLHINLKDFFRNQFFEEKIKEGKCYDDYVKYNYFYCDKDIKIDIGKLYFERKKSGLKFEFNSEDFFIEYNNKNFFLIAFGVEAEKGEVILGYPFVKKYDLIFDTDKRHVGFYNFNIKNNEDNSNNNKENDVINDNSNKNSNNKRNNNISNTEKILLTILIIVFIILFLFFVFITFRQCQRKRKGKLFSEVFL